MTGNLVLASASPRRAELLRQLDIAFTVIPADIDETVAANESAECYVRRMAQQKAAVIARGTAAPVLGADTAVIVDGDILGKPRDRVHARQMLRRLSGRCHQVLTAVCLEWNGRQWQDMSVSDVCFAAVADADITRYLDSGEADDKAGAYGIQGRAAQFISRMAGSYSGVVGLPLYETVGLLREAGVHYE